MRKEKNERVSVRCTSKEKEILNERAEKLELNLSDYVKKILFSEGTRLCRTNTTDYCNAGCCFVNRRKKQL